MADDGFTGNYAGIGEMLSSDFMQAAMLAKAEKVKAAAEAAAPFDPTDKDGDHYRDHFKDARVTVEDRRGRRAVGIVENDHVAAFQIEVGTSDTPAHHTLTRALDAAKE
jgi:hypothetical protein